MPPVSLALAFYDKSIMIDRIMDQGDKTMANIIICADGTWNRPEEDLKKDFPANVLKLSRAINSSADDLKQYVFYDWV